VTVYVESNFVLECALQQEESASCNDIIALAASGRITLVIPAFSLAEPHQAISGKAKVRTELGNQLRRQLNELGRSKPYHAIPATFGSLASVLIASAELERDGLKRTISNLLSIAEIVALDAAILNSAAALQVQVGLSGQDSIVLASILAHLDSKKSTESCFLNRNTKDFDDPDIREALEKRGCKFLTNFEDGLRYVQSRIATN
jgi:hypothetical protein